jgi:hypothetical protein
MFTTSRTATSAHHPQSLSSPSYRNRNSSALGHSISSEKPAATDHATAYHQKASKSTKEQATAHIKQNDKVTQQATHVPVPIPDTGITVHSSLPSVASLTMANTNIPTTAAIRATSSLASMAASILATPTRSPSPPSSTLSSDGFTTSEASDDTGQVSRKLPLAIILLIITGSICALVGALLVIKACSRRSKPSIPTPSLPILNEDLIEKCHELITDSPIFGGKERLSSNAGGHSGLLAWTQYPQPVGLATTQTVSVQTIDAGHVSATSTNSAIEKSSYNNSSLRSQTLDHTASRKSLTSISIYADAFELSDHPFEESMERVVRNFDTRKSITDSTKLPSRSSELPYAASPLPHSTAEMPRAFVPQIDSMKGGRSRIKSSYYVPGSYPRISTLPPPSLSSIKPKSNDPGFAIMPQMKASSGDLPTAFSSFLIDTTLQSPVPTIYPDDSLSTRKAIMKVQRKLTPKFLDEDPTISMSPTLDTSSALGTLMMMESGPTSKSLADIGTRVDGVQKSASGRVSRSWSGNSVRMKDDKPPRVPSPPPLPSLAQMGLEADNPQAYADYRSPTYSIYGLYQNEPKSRGSLYRVAEPQ